MTLLITVHYIRLLNSWAWVITQVDWLVWFAKEDVNGNVIYIWELEGNVSPGRNWTLTFVTLFTVVVVGVTATWVKLPGVAV